MLAFVEDTVEQVAQHFVAADLGNDAVNVHADLQLLEHVSAAAIGQVRQSLAFLHHLAQALLVSRRDLRGRELGRVTIEQLAHFECFAEHVDIEFLDRVALAPPGDQSSRSSRLRASRTGVRLTFSFVASSFSVRRAPSESWPVTIIAFNDP